MSTTFQNELRLPSVSVIIPSFNPDRLIFETLDCLYTQTFRDFEIIIVNDGSTQQSSIEIFAEIAAKYCSIKIIKHETNKGLPAARNTGIKAATCDYVFFLDGDDLISPTAIEKHYLTLQNNNSFDFVNSYVIGFGAQSYEWRGGFHDGEAFLHENRNTSCFMARRSIFEKITFDESLRHGCEDWDFWLNSASKGLWGYTIPEFLFYYRKSGNADRWHVLSSTSKIEKFGTQIRDKYQAILKKTGFPQRKLPAFQFSVEVDKEPPLLKSTSAPVKNKLLLIFPWLEIGGADKFNLDFITGLKENGWEITIACTLKSNHPWLSEFQKLTDHIFLLDGYSGPHEYFKSISYLIRSRDIELIFISNSLYGYYLLPYIKTNFSHIPIVDCIHCEEPGWLNGGYPRISNAFSIFIDKTIVTTGHLKAYIESIRGCKKNDPPIEVCYTSIDPSVIKKNIDYRKNIRDSWGITEEFTVILFSARMVEQKQPLVFAQTINKLRKKTENFVCVVLGDGPLLNPFKDYVYANNLENKIWCMGAVKHEEHLKYMDIADIFFLPSANEGIAITLYESMAKELVVVGAAVGGQRELVDDNTGYLITRSDPEQESDKYSAILLSLINDTSRRDTLKKNARKKIESAFDIKQMYAQVHNSLKDVIKNPAKVRCNIDHHYLFMLGLFINEEIKSNILWNDYINLKQSSSVKADVKFEQAPSPTLTGTDDLTWTKQEYNKLKDWYAKEYEVLPVWYKRVGHIVKAFKGHRTFTSLFKNDQAN